MPSIGHSSVPTVVRVKDLHHFAGSFGIGDPFGIEIIGTVGHATIAFAGIDHAGVAAVHELEEVILRLAGAAGIADQRLRELGVLDAVLLFAAFAQRAAIEADDRRMAEIGIDAVEAGGVGDRDIDVVRPRHRLGHDHLLVLGRIHVALAAHDQLGALHRAVAPDLRDNCRHRR